MLTAGNVFRGFVNLHEAYSPCWCRSGKIYRACHLDRDRQTPIEQHEVLTRQTATLQYATCLHPDAGSSCSPKIVAAHTVQRCGGGLQRIAKDGHVYGLNGHYAAIRKHEGKPRPERIGLRKASTFAGFCDAHDAPLFAPVETRAFTASQEQVFLLGFRGVARELYCKRVALEQVQLLRELDRGWPLPAQREYQAWVAAVEKGTRLSLRHLNAHKAEYDATYRRGDYQAVHGYVVTFDAMPGVLCTSALLPECDFAGKTIQHLGTGAHQQAITFSIIATESGGAAVFGWLGKSWAAEQLVRSLDALPLPDVSAAIVRFCFEFFENIFIAPTWWESLSDDVRDALVRRLLTGGSLFHERQPTALLDDGLRVATWQCVSRRFI